MFALFRADYVGAIKGQIYAFDIELCVCLFSDKLYFFQSFENSVKFAIKLIHTHTYISIYTHQGKL